MPYVRHWEPLMGEKCVYNGAVWKSMQSVEHRQ